MREVIVTVAALAAAVATFLAFLAIPAALLWSILWVWNQFDHAPGKPWGPWDYVLFISVFTVCFIPWRRR